MYSSPPNQNPTLGPLNYSNPQPHICPLQCIFAPRNIFLLFCCLGALKFVPVPQIQANRVPPSDKRKKTKQKTNLNSVLCFPQCFLVMCMKRKTDALWFSDVLKIDQYSEVNTRVESPSDWNNTLLTCLSLTGHASLTTHEDNYI